MKLTILSIGANRWWVKKTIEFWQHVLVHPCRQCSYANKSNKVSEQTDLIQVTYFIATITCLPLSKAHGKSIPAYLAAYYITPI